MKMLVKTIKITNRRNVLVQIPGFIIAAWPGADELGVYYDEDNQTVTIKPNFQGGSLFTEESDRVVSTSNT